MVSAMANGIVEATMLGPVFIMPISLFAGLMVNLKTVFVWLRWIQWLSPIRYCLQAFLIAQWNGSPITRNIYQVQLGFGDRLNYWDCLFPLIALAVFFRILSVVALVKSIKKF